MATGAGAHALAGAISSLVGLTATYPLLSISTRLQVLLKGTATLSSKESDGETGSDDEENGMLSSMLQAIQGCYKGLRSALFGTAAAYAIYYYTYRRLQVVFLRARRGHPLTSRDHLLIPALAGAITTVLTNPIWVVNTRMITAKKAVGNQAPQHEGSSSSSGPSPHQLTTWQCCKEIYQQEGAAGFTHGLQAALILVSNPTIQHWVFERLCHLVLARRQRGQRQFGKNNNVTLTSAEIFALSAIGKAVATVITYPYIVMKSRLQAKGEDREGSGPRAQATSATSVLYRMLTTEGVSSLYRGMSFKLIQSVLNASILFVTKARILTLMSTVSP